MYIEILNVVDERIEGLCGWWYKRSTVHLNIIFFVVRHKIKIACGKTTLSGTWCNHALGDVLARKDTVLSATSWMPANFVPVHRQCHVTLSFTFFFSFFAFLSYKRPTLFPFFSYITFPSLVLPANDCRDRPQKHFLYSAPLSTLCFFPISPHHVPVFHLSLLFWWW
jgi:hypothetical protein